MFDFDNTASEICNDDKALNDISNKIFLEKIECAALFFNLYNVLISYIDTSDKNQIRHIITNGGEIIYNVYNIIKKIINVHFTLKTTRLIPVREGRIYKEYIYENDIFYIIQDIYNKFHITLRNDMSNDGLSHALSVYNLGAYQQELLHRYNLLELNKTIENSFYGRDYY